MATSSTVETAPISTNTTPRSQTAVKAVMQSIVARTGLILINAATGIVTARSLNLQGRGELSAMIIWPVLLANAMTLGLPSALTYNIRRNRSLTQSYIGSALLLAMAVTAIAAGIAALFLPAMLRQYPAKEIWYAQWLLANAPVGILLAVARASFEAHEDFTASNRSLWLVALFNLGGLIALAVFRVFTPVSAAFIYVFCSFPIVIWVVWKLWREYRPNLRHFVASGKTLLQYGVRSYGIDLCGTLAQYVDQTLVVGMLSPSSMGAYVIALSLSRMLGLTQASVVMVLFPKAVGRSGEEMVMVASFAARVSTVLTAGIGIFVAAFGPSLLHLLYGREYVVAAAILRLLIIEVVISGAISVLSQVPMALGRPGVVTILQGIGLALTVPFMMVLIPRYGLLGAGYALLLSTCCRLLFITLSFKYLLKLPFPRLGIGRADFLSVCNHASSLLPRWWPGVPATE